MDSIRTFASRHPRIVAWIALAIGMVIILLWAAKDVGLLPTQLLALAVATVVLAGLCVWIIGWEDEVEEQAPDDSSSQK
jgi:amino acid permease